MGCRARRCHRESCAYDVLIFDSKSSLPARNGNVIYYHQDIDDVTPGALLALAGARILQDDSMRLAPLLVRAQESHDALIADYARNLLTEAMMSAGRASASAEWSLDVASCWQKRATLCLANGALALQGRLPSTHALQQIRDMTSGTALPAARLLAETLGMQRAAPLLLERMCRATSELSSMAGDIPPDMVLYKSNALLADSLLPDCYLYVCNIASSVMARVRHRLRNDSKIRYLIPVAMDAERDQVQIAANAGAVRLQADRMLSAIDAPVI